MTRPAALIPGLVLGAALSSGAAWGQLEDPPPIQWERRFSGQGIAEALCVRETRDGGFVLAGSTHPADAVQATDGYLLKTDRNGTLAWETWERTQGSDGDDAFRYFEETADGGLILTGWTETASARTGLYLVKSDAAGNVVWEST